MSQIGFILVGIGMMGLLGEQNGTAARGVLLHMVNHSLFKLVLFLCAGVVFVNLHALRLDDIRGFGRKKPLLHAAFLLGAAGIAGVPLLNGFVSKSLLHEAIVEYGGGALMTGVEWIFPVFRRPDGGLYGQALYRTVLGEAPDTAGRIRRDAPLLQPGGVGRAGAVRPDAPGAGADGALLHAQNHGGRAGLLPRGAGRAVPGAADARKSQGRGDLAGHWRGGLSAACASGAAAERKLCRPLAETARSGGAGLSAAAAEESCRARSAGSARCSARTS